MCEHWHAPHRGCPSSTIAHERRRERDFGTQWLTMLSHGLLTGLVHIAPGESSEVIPLSEWLRFSTLFNVLRNIR